MAVKVCVFDAYGTLFDVSAAARDCASEPEWKQLDGKWQKLAFDWRMKQLQYTWLRAVTGDYSDFWTVTQNSLDWALASSGLAGDPGLRERLLALYWQLGAYPEVPTMLGELKAGNVKTAILSNGSHGMLRGAVRSAGVEAELDAILSVESVGVFKPHRTVYALVEAKFGTDPQEVLFVSSNGWDAAAGAGFGFRSVWVNRAGEPMDRLPWKPDHELADLSGVPNLARPS